jgi:hypothetical protein
MPNFEIISRGNDKLGPHPYHVNLPSVVSCPGATSYCADKVCYTKHFVRYPNVARKYNSNLELWETDPAEYEARIMRDLEKLPANKIHDFRWHVSGDIMDVPYARMIMRIAEYFPRINFWVYTRSYRIPEIATVLNTLETYDNVRVWYSTDPELPPVPDKLEARIFENEWDARAAGYAVCPEQVGRKESCEDCRLCIDITKDTFRLAFIRH